MARYRRILHERSVKFVEENDAGDLLLIKGELLGPHSTTQQKITGDYKLLAPITPRQFTALV